jgi:hypothetical protein
MTVFVINDVDNLKISAFAQAFHELYRDKGPESDLDGNDLDVVLSLAVDALGEPAREFMFLVNPSNAERASNGDVVEITCPACSSDELKAAVALVSCYRYPDKIEITKLDEAYSTLASNDMEHSPSP